MSHEQVVVRAHQAESAADPGEVALDRDEALQEPSVVDVVTVDLDRSRAAGGDVVHAAGKVDPMGTAHVLDDTSRTVSTVGPRVYWHRVGTDM